MIQRLAVIFFFLITSIYNVKSQGEVHPEANFLEKNYNYFYHTVEQGQTVYSIAVLYNVAIEEIYRLNPGSEEVIKIGQELIIPQESGSYFYHTIQPGDNLWAVAQLYQMKGDDIVEVNPGLSIETFTIGKVIRIPTNKVTTPMEGNNEKQMRKLTNSLLLPERVEKSETVKVALIMSFGLKEGTTPANASSNRSVEYYEGFLLALSDLKKKGINVDVKVYDSGKGTDLIPEILKKEELQDIHLLIGGDNDAQIRLLSRFSAQNQIPFIIPYTSRSDEPLNNYYAYQINTPQSYLYSKTNANFIAENKSNNILFYENPEGNKLDFVASLKADLDEKKVPYQVIRSSNDLKTFLVEDKENVIVPDDDRRETLTTLLAPLKLFREKNPQCEISLFGHPIWQTYTAGFSDDFYAFHAGFYSIFYANPTSSLVRNFYKKYGRTYSRELINSYPKYAILAYDTSMYFIQLLAKYGSAYDTHINEIEYNGVQTNFHFTRINTWSGCMNTSIFFVAFNPDYTISSKCVR
ncbi:LysM peptidoglycan-binding domain-containing protein [Bacteroidales bacterium OttesenSCG-928-L03]|nr:LysM peptidoglycan-binding domain-containing protein [Bacteroidales bacterium OttesenSCG-928-L03]